jgi:hypothetical protein
VSDQWTSAADAEQLASANIQREETSPPPRPATDADVVQRRDRYTITVENYPVRATVDQEQRIRELDPAARARFLKIMGREQT